MGCLETSVRNYHYSPHNNPEARGSRLLRGGSLKQRMGTKVRPTRKYYASDLEIEGIFKTTLSGT